MLSHKKQFIKLFIVLAWNKNYDKNMEKKLAASRSNFIRETLLPLYFRYIDI